MLLAETDVEQHEVHVAFVENAAHALPGRGGAHLIFGALENAFEEGKDQIVIVDDEYVGH